MKKILCFIISVLLIISGLVFSTSAADIRAYSDEYYHPRFQKAFERLDANSDYFEFEEHFSQYNELMVYETENTVEYTLVFPMQIGHPKEGYAQLGEYVITFENIYDPYKIGYYVYVASEDEVYTLTEACDMNIVGISKAFDFLTQKGSCAVAGDADLDGKLNVKDATMIQKQLAGIVSDNPFAVDGVDNSLLYYGVKDFNLDYRIDIKDVTAIQKNIVGIGS